MSTPSTGVLLVNLGTPDAPEAGPVRRYLRQFLSDPRVIDIPAPARWLLLNLVILPVRPKTSAAAYRTIWGERGSPLLYWSRELARAVQSELGDSVRVRLAMRYQNPPLADALKAFRQEGVRRLIVLPLYGQYASSSTGSSLEEIYRVCGRFWNVPALSVVPPFFDHPSFLESLAAVSRESLGDTAAYDAFLISFHGLPERQIKKSDLDPQGYCLVKEGCCEAAVPANRYCYRAQCYSVAGNLAATLGISEDRYHVCFQSRLGRTPWIKPYTDELLVSLAREGVKKLAVLVPSFTADCLETLEEIGIRGRESFEAAGGEHLHLVPSLNAHPVWVRAVCDMVREQGIGT